MKPSQKALIAVTTDWASGQKCASFYQVQLGITQQASIAFQASWASLIVAFGLSTAKVAPVPQDSISFLVFICAFGWLLGTFWLHHQYQGRAKRIRNSYWTEQQRLFPGVPPYRLECYLLDDRTPTVILGLLPDLPTRVTTTA